MHHLCENTSKGLGDILLTFIGVELLYYVVIVSVVQQSESAVHMYIVPRFWISFSLRSPQSTE